jgi:hypothetical protein
MKRKLCSNSEETGRLICIIAVFRVKLRAFQKFENTVEALSDITAVVEGKVSKGLKQFLSQEISEKELKKESLAVADSKLGMYCIIFLWFYTSLII